MSKNMNRVFEKGAVSGASMECNAMAKIIITEQEPGIDPEAGAGVRHLDDVQLDRLMEAFAIWHDAAASSYIRRVRGRYRLAFLLLRYTGARLGEVLRVDDASDIDYEGCEVRIAVRMPAAMRQALRTVPLPPDVVASVLDYLNEFPAMQGRVFALDQGNFRREFYRRAEEARIPRPLSHPHILRHTRAIEMLRAGVPLTVVQDILGHVLSSSTTVYLQRPEVIIRRILKDRGLL